MKDIAYFVLPLGMFLSILLLSGIAMFQRVAIHIQKKSICFQIYSYNIKLSIASIVSVYALVRLLITVLDLKSCNKIKNTFENTPLPNFDRLYFKKIRLQRNFWILLLCSITWVFYVRFTSLIIYYRQKVKQSDDEYEQLLKKKRVSKTKTDNSDEIKNKSDNKLSTTNLLTTGIPSVWNKQKGYNIAGLKKSDQSELETDEYLDDDIITDAYKTKSETDEKSPLVMESKKNVDLSIRQRR
ncbi:conserved protein, unknown function [Hepatocystis sp. ex Piliocolobus tephrosceles]|nr:conserved protein, unknown function [Hepatocystis sp. ex Piliocolobus tephrosceles]